MQTHTNGVSTKQSKGRTMTLKPERSQVSEAADVKLYRFEREIAEVEIAGLTPLLINNLGSKTIQEMEDLRRLTAEEQKAAKKAPKPPVIPEEKWMAARILDGKGQDCGTAVHVKAAMVTAAKDKEVGVSAAVVKGTLFIVGDLLPIVFAGATADEVRRDFEARYGASLDVARYLGKQRKTGLPYVDRKAVRVGPWNDKKPDLRYRPRYEDWSFKLRIEYEPAKLSLDAIMHLIRRAGASVGLYEFRPEKSPAGTYGRFDLAEMVRR